MKYKKYPAYKDNGVEGMGEIPDHWGVAAVWMLFRLGRGRVISNEEILEHPGPYPVYSSQTEEEGVMGYLDTFDFEGEYITWTTDGANAGTVFHRSGRFNCTNVCGTLFPARDDLNLRFFRHAINNATDRFVRQDINPKLMNNVMAGIRIQIPSPSEQTAIAAFLDTETAQIDTLIAKQERLIATLQEKRQALISHAVTRGLNPDAAMKESGIEWLGEVPAHWEVKKIKYHFEFKDSQRIPLSSEERSHRQGEYPYYGASGIIDYIDDFIFDEPLLLIGEDGANLLSRSSPLAFIATGKYWVNNHAHILKPRDSILNFWAYRLEQIDYTPWISGSAQPKLTADSLARIHVAVPVDLSERYAITNFLDQETAQIDILIEKAKAAIERLQERRTALISAAVTGKIDVRAAMD